MTPTGPPAAAGPAHGGTRRRLALRRTLLIAAVIAVMMLVGGVAFAATPAPAPIPAVPPGPPVAGDLNAVLNNIRNWVMGILALLSTVALTAGGVRYLISNGDPAEINKAKEAFRNAGWGYALTALAPVGVAILKQIVGG
ncbi:pilin [Pseudofrankia sp. DC12]|uniref:pilin n=1 Tax=Pseudofrankia sp. DC12 TaxID=683315 RepID=UPI0005F86108|nr:pilin [Pseudofrankia sp. DC12]